ncbi:MAG: hypothetical protein ABEI77_07585 [Halorientalis sp.]
MIPLLLALGIVALLGWWTVERFVFGDGSDPSIWFGGGSMLLRASGLALIGVAIIAASALLYVSGAWNAKVAAVLLALFVVWFVSEEEESES